VHLYAFADEGFPMGKGTTKGTRQIFAEITTEIRKRFDERVEAEQRTIRAVLERALTFYMDHVPVEAAPSLLTPLQPKRNRPAKGQSK